MERRLLGMRAFLRCCREVIGGWAIGPGTVWRDATGLMGDVVWSTGCEKRPVERVEFGRISGGRRLGTEEYDEQELVEREDCDCGR